MKLTDLFESINDAGIFKAIFIIGIPGAGKSYTIKKLTGTVSPRIVNTDIPTEYFSKKTGIKATSETWRTHFREKSQTLAKNMLAQYLNGMLPLFVDGTSNDASNLLHRIGILESLGYDVGVIHINTPLDVAIARSKARAEKIGREVDTEFIEKVFRLNADNVAFIKSKVSFFMEIDNNSDGYDDAVINNAFKKSQGFFSSKLVNPIGIRTLAQLREAGGKYLAPDILSLDTLKKKVDGWYK